MAYETKSKFASQNEHWCELHILACVICMSSVCGLLAISSRSHVAVERPSRRGTVTVEALESPANNF